MNQSKQRPKKHRAHAAIEALERRTMLSVVVVNTTTDVAHGAGLTSLRDAVAIADSAASATTIEFDPTAFAAFQTIDLVQGPLDLSNASQAISIVAPAAGVEINGQNASSIARVEVNTTATLSGLTLTAGHSAANGGAIANWGTLNISGALISSNFAANDGGAVINSGTLTIANSTITGNTGATSSTSSGVALYNRHTLTLTNDVISGNTGNFGAAVANGHGAAASMSRVIFSSNYAAIGNLGAVSMYRVRIQNSTNFGVQNQGTANLLDTTISGTVNNGGFNNSVGAHAKITDSTFIGNKGEVGGALNNDGTATVINSTMSGNIAGNGAAIYNQTGATMTIADCTIAGNSAFANDISQGVGGGIYANSPVTISNTIVATNFGDINSPDTHGAFNSLGHNIIGDDYLSSGWLGTDQTGTYSNMVNPLLGALALNGGFTETMLPAGGSPAINAGSNALIPAGLTTDQRGNPRIDNGVVDIGAVET